MALAPNKGRDSGINFHFPTSSAPMDQTLACLVTGYFPQKVKIQWNSLSDPAGSRSFPEVLKSDGLYTTSSMLAITASNRQSNPYHCDVTHDGTKNTVSKKFPLECKNRGRGRMGQQGATTRSSLEPTIYMSKPSYEDLIKQPGRVSCLVLGYDLAATAITWEVDGKVSSAVKTEPAKNNTNGTSSLVSSHTVSLAQWLGGSNFTCKGEPGMPPHRAGQSPIHPVPMPFQGLCPPLVSSTLICETSGFYPQEISISWLKNNSQEVKSSYNNGPVSASGTFSAYSILKVERSEGAGTYSCVVHHPALKEPKSVVEKVFFGKCIPRGQCYFGHISSHPAKGTEKSDSNVSPRGREIFHCHLSSL
uniref:Ig-like domain-containing protein n=1 Tax=Pelusios castaneus TaxID=367368 RepID=A0A8C8S812_9SAUR